MNSLSRSQVSIADIVKQVLSVILVVSGLVAFYFFSEIPLIYRVVGLLVIAVAVVALMITTDIGKAAWVFVLESKLEVRKIIWPSRDETTRTTILVFAMVFTVGIVLWLLDMFLFWGVRLLTGQGG